MATELGTLTSGTPSSGGINGAKIRVRLFETKSAAGKTKVSWKVDLIGRSTSPTKATTKISLKITTPTSGASISNITGNSYNSGSEIISYNNNTDVLSGSCFVYHNTNGEAKIKVVLDGLIAGWEGETIDRSKTFTLETNKPYTKCGAPTSITVNKTIIKPEDEITISWSGATDGTANTINGYEIYYNFTSTGDKPTTSSFSISVGEDISSYTFQFKAQEILGKENIDDTRGYSLIFAIVTKGSAGFDYYSDMEYSNAITINKLPNSPSVTMNKMDGLEDGNIIPSSKEAKVRFIYSAGTDEDSTQTIQVYFSTTQDGDKTLVPLSPWDTSINKTITYYFWSYDGLEYSKEAVKIKFVKNTETTFEIEVSEKELKSENNKTDLKYQISPTIQLYNIQGGQQNKKFTYTLYYGNDIAELENSKILFDSTLESKKEVVDIRKDMTNFQENGAYYKIGVKCNDGVEDSTEVFTNPYYITKIPNLKGLYNKSNFTNVEGFYETNDNTKATHYSKFLGFIFDKDEGYNRLKFKDYNSNIQTINLTTGEKDTRGSWENADEIDPSVSHDLSYQLEYSQGYSYTAISRKVTKIAKTALENFKFAFNNGPYKFFTDSGTYINTVGHGYNTSPLISGSIKDYGISDILNEKHIFVKFYSNNLWSEPINVTPEKDSTNNNTISFNLVASSIANAISKLFTSEQKNMNYSSTVRLYIKNDFEDENYIESTFTISFIENDKIFLSSQDIHPNDGNNKNYLDEWEFLKEGMNLIGNFKITSYNTNPTGEIQIRRSTEASWQSLISFSFSGSGEAKPGFPIQYSASDLLVQAIGTISNFNYQISYKLIVKTDAGSTEFELYSNIPVRGHIPATLTILSNSYDGEDLTIKYKFSNFGADTTNLKLGNGNQISLYTVGENESVSYTIKDDDINGYFSDFEKTATFTYNFNGSESRLVKLGITTSLSTYLKNDASKTPYFETTKATILDMIEPEVIFNLLPTIAYRKNHLGINILDPSANKNSIITIGEAPGRDTIYFQSADKKFCKVDNFLVDGDSWDGTSGGLAGSKPPDNLARVAYTGEIGDLNQTNKEIVIIISGGTASNYF